MCVRDRDRETERETERERERERERIMMKSNQILGTMCLEANYFNRRNYKCLCIHVHQ